MQNLTHKIHAQNLISVCIDEASGEDFSGRIYHQYQEDAIPFRTLLGCSQIMDRLYDDWDFPQSAVRARKLQNAGDRNPRGRAADSNLQDNPAAGSSLEDILEGTPVSPIASRRPDYDITGQRGRIATLLVQVKYRQYATWQGEALYIEENQKQIFRSELEFLDFVTRNVKKVNS